MNEKDQNEEVRQEAEAEEITTPSPNRQEDPDEHVTNNFEHGEGSAPSQSPTEPFDDEQSHVSDPESVAKESSHTISEDPSETNTELTFQPTAHTIEHETAEDATAEGESKDREVTADEVPTRGDAEAQPPEEETHRCPRMLLQAGTDEQSLRALALCREKVKQLHLRMRPLAARYEGEKHVTIYFRADDKVDFRKLVRELSRLLHARIELRQVGPREQGKLCGLLGKCGYNLCCQTFLGQLAQSTIKMAKTQELALNPMKISGVCGRLLCCLNYEQDMYIEAKSRMPKVNRVVDTEFGPGRVIAVNVLKGTVTVQLETMVKELRPEQIQTPENHG